MFFYRCPLRASNLFERIQVPCLLSELHFGLWHSSIPFYCLNTVIVLWAGLWVAVHTGTRHPKCLILSQKILLPGFESGLHDKLWHRSAPSYLNTVYVSWAGLWVAVRTAPGTRSAHTIPKDPTTRVWIWNTWQAVTYKYTILYTLKMKTISYMLQTLKCYWSWKQIRCWDEKIIMLINF